MNINNKPLFIGKLLMAVLFLSLGACKIEKIEDPNNPSLGVISENASLSEIQNLVDGIQAGARINLGQYLDGVGAIGRDFYRFSTSDPRFTSDLLGKGEAQLDNNTFYTTNPYAGRYRTVKNCNILITAITNTKAAVTAEQRKAAIGFANTIKAYQLLLVWTQQYKNGIRIDVADPDNLGPFEGVNDPAVALSKLSELLESAYTDLKDGGDSFPFALNAGFNQIENFTTPPAFAKVNRALAARVFAYNQKWTDALAALNNSFMDLNGDFYNGAYLIYSLAGGDEVNPLWFPADATGESRVTQPSFVSDAEAGDLRLSKAAPRASTEFQDGLQSDYNVTVYASNTSPIAIIRNEELILIYAEASAQLDHTADAVNALNDIRQQNGLNAYSGGTSKDELINEMLKQRRYSLFAEGHRWVDMRRYGRLSQLPIDRPGDDVWEQYPRPQSEGN